MPQCEALVVTKPFGPRDQAFVVMFRFRHKREAMCLAPARDGFRAQRIAQQSSRKHDGDQQNDGESCAHRAKPTTDELTVNQGLRDGAAYGWPCPASVTKGDGANPR